MQKSIYYLKRVKQIEQFWEIVLYFWNISMPHDTEIPLLVSYSRRIFTHVYQEYFISIISVIAKKKPWKEPKWTSIVKWRKKLLRIGHYKNEN